MAEVLAEGALPPYRSHRADVWLIGFDFVVAGAEELEEASLRALQVWGAGLFQG